MSERFDGRAIERTQPGPITPGADPGEALRAHVERSPRRPPETELRVSDFARRYVLDVRAPSGKVVDTYGGSDEQRRAAREHAKRLQGFTTAHEVVDDFR